MHDMRSVILFLVIIAISQACDKRSEFDRFFNNETMRVDFNFYGNANSEDIRLLNITKEPFWGGSISNFTDKLDYGEYKFEILDSKTNELIYSQGFSTLFEEWQTTLEADTIFKEFSQSILFPEPKSSVDLKIYSRMQDGNFEEIFSTSIDPTKDIINKKLAGYPVLKILDNGDPATHLDIVLLAEGYTIDEMGKFEKDAKRLTDYMFEYEPYKSNKDKVNIWLVKSESEQSGTDIPGENIYKKTALNSNFYTFGSERYLMTEDFLTVRNVASLVPYDDICILVNSEKYGGGGIYNYYAITSVDHALSEEVFIHEFGHSFAGLGDEYYNSSTAYNDFYNLEIEPWQPNLTTLINFDVKWSSMVNDSVPIPTPREIQYEDVVGAYEGGGYVNKGMYSPYMDCRMKTNVAKGFCPVCQESILKMIQEKTK
ncbi:MAG: peptidase M64 [Marinilabiliales bacterium]|nr:MAG: peptidase M64 [Marinilabiliales bacterium]